MKTFRAPKTITNHPAVREALDGFFEGFDSKYDVCLQRGWFFTNDMPDHYDWQQAKRFNTVAEFKAATITHKPDQS